MSDVGNRFFINIEKHVLQGVFDCGNPRRALTIASEGIVLGVIRDVRARGLIVPRLPAPQGWKLTQAGLARLNELTGVEHFARAGNG